MNETADEYEKIRGRTAQRAAKREYLPLIDARDNGFQSYNFV